MAKYIALLILLGGCQMTNQEAFDAEVANHEQLLRRHFLGKYTGYDVAGLINRTTDIANRLRGHGRLRDANRFDSYRDVLIYGKLTIKESLDDVERLIYNQHRPTQCLGFWQSLKNSLSNIFH